MSSNFLLKVFKLEYYFEKPFSEFQLPYSDLLGRACTRLPVIRCYGSSPSGQKMCAHIHGVLPYLFIEDHSIASCSDVGQLRTSLRSVAQRIETTLSKKATDGNYGKLYVYDIQPLSARSIYGYRNKDSTFLKICLTDPSDIAILSELLLSGEVLGIPVQPFEVHIPYLLQFCADYNIQGMNYIEATSYRIRDIRTRKIDSPNDPNDPLTFVLTQEHSLIGSPEYGQRISLQRQSSTDVEVDISACDILNRLEVAEDEAAFNPGLSFLWAEERARREALRNSGLISVEDQVVPTADVLLPLSERKRQNISSSQ